MSEVVVTKGRIPLLEPPLEQRIRHGAWALVAVFVASFAVQLFTQNPPLTWWGLVDLPIVGVLAYGLNRKSRLAAVMILVYLAWVAVAQLITLHSLPIGPYIILAFFLGRAIPAVFRYHARVRDSASAAHVA
jgi:hypothetical protein